MNDLWAAMLNEDMRGEHMAIVQYLLSAYALGEGAVACEIEAVARDEMRHYSWLADTIVRLGGKPTIERAPIHNTLDSVENMRLNVVAEEEAIGLYAQHIEAIDDPTIERLLRRIADDENRHLGIFKKLVDEVQALLAASELSPGTSPDPVVQQILDAGIRHEYTVILQYLYHRFASPDCPIGRELEMQSINEMQHMGWLAEELCTVGGRPVVERTMVNLADDLQAMLAADIAAERDVTKVYEQQIALIEDAGLKQLITTIRGHEVYHDAVFSDMLAKLQAMSQKPAKPESFTVGSLRRE